MSEILVWYKEHNDAIYALWEIFYTFVPGGIYIENIIKAAQELIGEEKKDAQEKEVIAFLEASKPVIEDFVYAIEKQKEFKEASSWKEKITFIQESEYKNRIIFSSEITSFLSLFQHKYSYFLTPNIPEINERYTDLNLLGKGSLGFTFKGFDQVSKRNVVIKFLPDYFYYNPFALEQLEKKFFEIQNEFQHEYIVKYRSLEVSKQLNKVFLVTDYIAGKNLKEFLQEKKTFSSHEVFTILSSASKALDFAHQRNMPHGNIKPENILWNEKESFLADFALSQKILELLPNQYVLKEDKTHLYMPPEIFQGKSYDKASDIWVMGAITYQLLYGSHPTFEHYKNNLSEKKEKNEIYQTILTMLERDKKDRSSSVFECIQSLQMKKKEKDSPKNKGFFKGLTKALKNPAKLYSEGKKWYDQEKYEDAVILMNKVLNIDKNYIDAYLCRGLSYYELGKFNEAIEDMTKLIKLDSQNPSYYIHRAYALEKLKKKNAAIRDYSSAIEIKPSYQYYNYRSHLYMDLEQYKDAIHDFSIMIEQHPKSTHLYYNRGKAYMALQTSMSKALSKKENHEIWLKALDDFSTVIEQKPQDTKAYLKRVALYCNLDRKDEMFQDYQTLLELCPDNKEVYYDRGLIHFEYESFEEALTDFNKAISLDENYAEAYYEKGNVYHSMEKFEEASRAFSLAIEKEPSHLNAYYYRALCYDALGKTQEAIEDCTTIINMDPEYVFVHLLRSELYKSLGELEKSKDDLAIHKKNWKKK